MKKKNGNGWDNGCFVNIDSLSTGRLGSGTDECRTIDNRCRIENTCIGVILVSVGATFPIVIDNEDVAV
jgi:hypothetical protein